METWCDPLGPAGGWGLALGEMGRACERTPLAYRFRCGRNRFRFVRHCLAAPIRGGMNDGCRARLRDAYKQARRPPRTAKPEQPDQPRHERDAQHRTDE